MEKNAGTVVAIATAVAFAMFAGLALARYALVRANGLDLGIYGQVLWNTAHGHWFAFTVHPHSYLGDHVEFILLALAPFAGLFRVVPVLLIAQALALAVCGPLAFALARQYFPRRTSAIITVVFLANPFLLSTALYEFHALAFAIPILLSVILAYERRNLSAFLALSALALTVREDIAPIVAAFGLLALWDRRKIQWWLPTVVVGTAWFIGAVQLAAALSGYAKDKFLAYYRWLGDSPMELLAGLVQHPILVAQHLLSLGNLGFTIGLLGAFALLPLFALRRLLPIAPAFALLALGSGSVLALQIHYTAPFIPFLFWASVVALARIFNGVPGGGLIGRLQKEREVVTVIVVAAAIYTAGFLGPLPGGIAELFRTVRDPSTAVRRALVANLPKQTPLATGYAFLASSAERAELSSLHYQYLGTLQFSTTPYAVPEATRTAVWDFSDTLIYQNLYPEVTANGRDAGADRLRALWTGRNQTVVASFDGYVLTESGGAPSPLPYTGSASKPEHSIDTALTNGLRFDGYDGPLQISATPWFGKSVFSLAFGLTLSADRAPEVTRNLLLRFRDDQGTVRLQRVIPVANGFYHTVEWPTGERVRTDYNLAVQRNLAGTTLSIQLVTPALSVVLSPLRTIVVSAPADSLVGPEVTLGQVQAESTTR